MENRAIARNRGRSITNVSQTIKRDLKVNSLSLTLNMISNYIVV